MRYLTAGESHGKALVGILEGMPSHIKISLDKINEQLARRQQGYGRGGRMAIERDTAEILSGVRGGVTLGSPIAIMIVNRDYANWQEVMCPVSGDWSKRQLTAVRPGHADLSGCIKYGFDDARNVLERASARETAMRVAIGAICRQYLEQKGIEVTSRIVTIGGVGGDTKIKAAIDKAKADGDTLGGICEVVIKGVPVGLGSHVHYDRKLDALMAMHLMSIQSVKAVEVGLGVESARLRGSQVHDEIVLGNSEYKRKSNNAGGIEGGMSNGEDIVVRVSFKPIPTLMKGLDTVDIKTGKAVKAAPERSDVCAVEAGAVVAENVAAFVIADALEK